MDVFCSFVTDFEMQMLFEGAYSCLPSKNDLNYSLCLFKGW